MTLCGEFQMCEREIPDPQRSAPKGLVELEESVGRDGDHKSGTAAAIGITWHFDRDKRNETSSRPRKGLDQGKHPHPPLSQGLLEPFISRSSGTPKYLDGRLVPRTLALPLLLYSSGLTHGHRLGTLVSD